MGFSLGRKRCTKARLTMAVGAASAESAGGEETSLEEADAHGLEIVGAGGAGLCVGLVGALRAWGGWRVLRSMLKSQLPSRGRTVVRPAD